MPVKTFLGRSHIGGRYHQRDVDAACGGAPGLRNRAARRREAGADGVISVAANVAPALFAAMCAACARQDAKVGLGLDQRLRRLYALLGVEPNPIPVKWCLSLLGFGEPGLRLPLLPMSDAYRAEAASALAELGLALAS